MRSAIVVASVALVVAMATIPMSGQSAPAAAHPQMTFAKDVAPILQRKCQVCHRAGTFAPMSLVSYDEVRPFARAIKQKVTAREMPPWFIDHNVGVQHFANEGGLTDEEIATISTWVDDGAPLGNKADMPAPRVFPKEETWQFGKPDVVVSLPTDIAVIANGPDMWPSVLVDPGLKEDRYLQAIQVIPTKGFTTIHHIRTSLVAPADASNHAGQVDGQNGPPQDEQGVFLNEYAIGKGADVFREGSGRLIKAGTKINVGFHLHPNGKPTPMNVSLGLKLYPVGYRPKHIIVSAQVRYPEIDIRPNSEGRVDGYMVLTKPTRLLSYQPHMHDRGKSACIEVIYPTETGVLRSEPINCARFFFNWHINYVYADDAAPLLPAGTVIHTTQWYDNTAANKFNPDPDMQITYGQRTVDEMAGAWLSFYQMTDEEYKQESADRGVRQRTVAAR